MTRDLHGIDGAILTYDGAELLFILFAEPVASLGGPSEAEVAQYGYLLLRRAEVQRETDVSAVGTSGATAPGDPERPGLSTPIGCSPGLLTQILHDTPDRELGPHNAERVAEAVLSGTIPLAEDPRVIAFPETAHYLCWDTGNFDTVCFSDETDAMEYHPRCPEESAVTYFTVSAAAGDPVPGAACSSVYDPWTGVCKDQCTPGEQLAESACPTACGLQFCCSPGPVGQPLAGERGTCDEVLRQWFAAKEHKLRLNPYWEQTREGAAPDAYRLTYKDVYQTNAPELITSGPEEPHYLCYDTGFVDAEHFDERGVVVPNPPCPSGSAVLFFTLADGTDARTLACQREPGECHVGEPCSSTLTNLCPTEPGNRCDAKGDCVAAVDGFRSTAQHWFRENVSWLCDGSLPGVSSGSATLGAPAWSCEEHLDNLLFGKTFYSATPAVLFPPLDHAVEQAFRYTARFPDRQQLGLGFAPEPCVPGSNRVPYCYDPPAIDEVRQRVQCAAHIYGSYYPELPSRTRESLRSFLERAWGADESSTKTSGAGPQSGFETRYAELFTVLGEETLTRALNARFSATGSSDARFAGSEFEPNGIELWGGVGYELSELYRSIQFFQLALDRFYELGPILRGDENVPRGRFLTPRTATVYYAQLLRASAKKAAAWSAVAQRYLWHQRPDLARSVVERAVSTAHLEANALGAILREQIADATEETRDEAGQAFTRAQLEHSAAVQALLYTAARVREQSSDANALALASSDGAGARPIEQQLATAEARIAAAAASEALATAAGRDFDGSLGGLTSELTALRQVAETRLAEICGTFLGNDGHAYPAIAPYAVRHPFLQAMSDPCGFTQSGSLLDAAFAVTDLQRSVDGVRAQRRLWQRAVERLTARATAQCGARADADAAWGGWQVAWGDDVQQLEESVDEMDAALDAVDWAVRKASVLAAQVQCDAVAGECPAANATVSAYVALAAAHGAVQPISPERAGRLQQLAEGVTLAPDDRRWLAACDGASIDTGVELEQRIHELPQLLLQIWRLQEELSGQLGRIGVELAEARRLLAQHAAYSQLLAEPVAATSDLNVRLVESAAAVIADQLFDAALAETDRVTRVFEYYVNQSYDARAGLVGVQRAAQGAQSLQAHVDTLRAAFDAFDREPGDAELRAVRYSVRDDIIMVPRVDEHGQALTETQRAEALRRELGAFMTANGGLAIPFGSRSFVTAEISRS